MGRKPYLVASAVQAIVAQRLVRRICEKCRSESQPDDSQKAWLRGALGEEAVQATFYAGTGCNQCNHTGFRGRIGVYELLEMDATLIDCLRRNDQGGFERAARAQPGYRPLVQHALELARGGVTTVGEAMSLAGWLESVRGITQ